MDAKVLQALGQCREKDRFMRGLVAWTGFKSIALPYDRPARQAGRTHYQFWKLLLLSLDAAVGFSITPLRLASALGFAITLLSMAMAGIIVVQRLVHHGMPFQGYALVVSGLFFLGGVQMLLLGILGEYIGRIYRQTQGRPLYLVSQKIPAGDLIGRFASQGPTGEFAAAPSTGGSKT
jgi:dolichol-phosphate mannosyltransferase